LLKISKWILTTKGMDRVVERVASTEGDSRATKGVDGVVERVTGSERAARIDDRDP
jgi:hypothetical protein